MPSEDNSCPACSGAGTVKNEIGEEICVVCGGTGAVVDYDYFKRNCKIYLAFSKHQV